MHTHALKHIRIDRQPQSLMYRRVTPEGLLTEQLMLLLQPLGFPRLSGSWLHTEAALKEVLDSVYLPLNLDPH